jgi:hypothetical protein
MIGTKSSSTRLPGAARLWAVTIMIRADSRVADTISWTPLLAEEGHYLAEVIARKFINQLARRDKQDGRHIASRKLGRVEFIKIADSKCRFALEFLAPESRSKLCGIATTSPRGREIDNSLATLREQGFQLRLAVNRNHRASLDLFEFGDRHRRCSASAKEHGGECACGYHTSDDDH